MAAEKHDDLVMQSLLLDEIGQSVIGLNDAWQVTYWNRASERLYGFTSAEVLGRRITELGIIAGAEVPGQETARQEIADGIAAGRGWAGEFGTRHRTGREFTVYASVSPVRGEHSVPVAVVAMSSDITERKRTEGRLSAMVESSGDAIIGADMEGTITSWNAGAIRMVGWSAQEAIGQSYRLLATRMNEGLSQVIAERLGSGTFMTGIEALWRHRDGSVVEVSLTLSPVYGTDGKQAGASAIARDITEPKRLQLAAAAELERLVAAQEMVHLGSVEHDIISDRWSHSDEYARIYGLAPGELVSRKQSLALVHPEDLELIQAARRALDSGTKRVEYEFRIIRADGELRWMQSRARMTHDATSGAPLRFLATVMDITDRKDAEQVLEWQARHDALTGLPNRYLLTDVLQGLLGRASQLVVMFVDVDRFKLVNDGIGHTAGDALLILLGERLRTAVRPNDTVGRFGGDEFVIVCENLGIRDAAAAAERIRAATRRPFEIDERKIFLNVSVGIAVSGPGDTAESLLHGADTAMYEAKAAGGDGSVVFDSRTTGQAAGRLDLQSDLRVALERDELFLEYQPVIELDTEQVVGFEALLRWQHGGHGLIMPDAFISIAEETGLIVPIGTWVLKEALAQVQRWRSTIPGAGNLSAAVNISARQLVAPDFPDIVYAAARTAGIDPAAVNLEITETVLMEQPELPLEILHRLHNLGVGLSIDDFGTGYSSLSYLKWMSARTLKIDRSFVEVLGADPHGASIIELILGMARTLDLVVIAEGVETHDQLTELRRLGIRHAQGYLWSKPMPAGQVPAWLQSVLPSSTRTMASTLTSGTFPTSLKDTMPASSSNAAKRAAVIINPAKPVDIDVRGLMAKHCADNGWGEPIWLETTKEDPGVGQAREALEQGADVVIAAGGDGTVRCVAEVLAGTGTPMGLLPLGTGNLLARNLGMDVTDVEGAMEGALAGWERKIDVVRAARHDPDKEQVFLVMAGVGYDATIMADTNEDLKDRVGWLAYVDAGIRNLPGKPVKATVVIDGKSVVHRRVRSVMVGNCGKVQGGLEIFPDAAVNDGLLDVVVLAPRGRLGWFSVIAGMIGRGKGRDTSVEYFQGKSVEITLDHNEDYQLDGDHEGEGKHVLMTIEPDALTIRMAPN